MAYSGFETSALAGTALAVGFGLTNAASAVVKNIKIAEAQRAAAPNQELIRSLTDDYENALVGVSIFTVVAALGLIAFYRFKNLRAA